MIDEAMSLIPYPDDSYVTPPNSAAVLSSFFPNISFYTRMGFIIKKAASQALRGEYHSEQWVGSSLAIRQALELAGVRFKVEGFANFKNLPGPCVFIGNHMSTLETFILPGLIRPFKPVTFVIKDSLLRYPVFQHVMRSREPIVVERKNARADFAAVMKGGMENLEKGISVIVFPQSTRQESLDKRYFNSMGVKLAQKAGVPVIPVALRSDAWGMGGFFGMLKDHGRIHPYIPVNFRFGTPISIKGNGKAEHEQVYSFIEQCLLEWGGKVTQADEAKALPQQGQ